MDWQTEVLFCDNVIVNSDTIAGLLADKLQLASVRTILERRYNLMRALFKDALADSSDWRQNGCTIADTRSHWDVLLGIPISMFNANNTIWCGEGGILNREDVGLDLPTWIIKNGVNPHMRIMVVAESPKRENVTAGTLWLSSPWAFHSKEYRDHPRNTRIRPIVETFMDEKNAAVYLTDIYKIYAKGQTLNNSEVDYRSILNREIELFNPSIIIGYGSKVLDALRPGLSKNPSGAFARLVCHYPFEDSYCGIRTLIFAHPSPLNATLNCVVANMIEQHPGLSRDEALLRYYTDWR